MHLYLKFLSLTSTTLLLYLVSPLSPTGKDALAQMATPDRTLQRDDSRLAQNRKIEADRLFQAGVEQLQNNQLQTALATFEQVLAIRRQLDDKTGEGEALLKLAEVSEKLGQNDRAQEYYRLAEAAGVRRVGVTQQLTVLQRNLLRDDQPSVSSAPRVTATGASVSVQTDQRDDNPSGAVAGGSRGGQISRSPNQPIFNQPVPAPAPSQTAQRDDDKPSGTARERGNNGRQLPSQTALRDDGDSSTTVGGSRGGQISRSDRNNSSIVSPGPVVNQTAQRDDDNSSVERSGDAPAPTQTAQRDDDKPPTAAVVAPTPQRDDNPIAMVQTNRKIEADRLFQTGIEQLQRRQFQPALTTFGQVLAIRRALGDKTGEGQTLFQMGKVYEQLGQAQQAQNYYRQARELGAR